MLRLAPLLILAAACTPIGVPVPDPGAQTAPLPASANVGGYQSPYANPTTAPIVQPAPTDLNPAVCTGGITPDGRPCPFDEPR